jgi:signal transduction histidine kinase
MEAGMLNIETATSPRPDAMSAGVVHDLGNLIQIASSAMNILARNPRVHASELEPVIAGARVSLDRAGALVRQTMGVMHARRATAGPADVAACLAEIEALVAMSWDAEFSLHMRVHANLPQIQCDPVSLQSAVLNLLLNARDAMPGGGDIAVAAIERDGEVEICVADNGVGMAPDTVRRAFEPFFTTKADGLGGVGLPMVERFVREVGGRVAVESELGIGTIVMLHLPAASAARRQGDA